MYFGIWITAKGADKIKKRYFSSHSILQDFNKKVLKRTKYSAEASWSLIAPSDLSTDLASTVPIGLKNIMNNYGIKKRIHNGTKK